MAPVFGDVDVGNDAGVPVGMADKSSVEFGDGDKVWPVGIED